MKSTLAISAIIFTVGVVTLPTVFSDSRFQRASDEYRSSGAASLSNPLYKEECGSCHMAYPPGLLAADSWRHIMDGLEDHFGDNAELDAATQKQISDFLRDNSADNSDYRHARKFLRNITDGKAVMRISDTPYFRDEHDEIPARLVSGNEKVNSFSQCNACHQQADKGVFNEDDVNIPGYGRWDD